MVYAKIDWYTAIFEHVTLKQICDKLHIDCTYYDELLQSNYERSLGYDSNFVINIHGVSFEIRYAEALEHFKLVMTDGDFTDCKSFFNYIFSKIRLDISGFGLDFLRCKFEVDTMMTDRGYWLPFKYHVTRADFAFDFVNEKYNDYFVPLYQFLIDKSISNLGRNLVRVSTCDRSLKFNIKSGDQECIYIGSSRSDRMLRIYNKKLQLCPDGIWDFEKIPLTFIEHNESNIETWFRIEFQTRNIKAENLLFSCHNDLKNILLLMESDYLFIGNDGLPLQFSTDLYDWSELQSIIQNAKYTPEPITVKKVEEQFDRNFVYIFCYLAIHGVEKTIAHINELYKNLYDGSRQSHYRERRLKKVISDVLTDSHMSISDLRGISLTNGSISQFSHINLIS